MKTILDEFDTTFLHVVEYRTSELRIVVAEGFAAAEPEDLFIGGVLIAGTRALDISDRSRFVEIRFLQPVAWQLVDESYTAGNDYEVREDTGVLQVLTQSRYLDYVRAHHGWFEEMRGPGKHYRIWTEYEVIDIVACQPPVIALSGADESASAGNEGDSFSVYRRK